MTLQEAAEAWLRLKSQQVKESTFAVYRFQVLRHLLPHFGSRSDITEEEVQRYVSGRLQAGISASTIKDRVGILRMIVHHAARQGWMKDADWEIRYSARKPRGAVALLPPAHQAAILRHVKEHPSVLNLGIYICLTTGLRIGEVCGLQWKDVDMTRSTITVRRTVERIYFAEEQHGRTRVLWSTPKTTHSCREIPITATVQAMATQMRGNADDDIFVLSMTPQPLEPRNYRGYFKRLLKEIGIPNIRFHALRHSFATRCIENNVDCKTVSEILGHANVGITLNLYTHPDMQQKRRCMDTMEQSLDNMPFP